MPDESGFFHGDFLCDIPLVPELEEHLIGGVCVDGKVDSADGVGSA